MDLSSGRVLVLSARLMQAVIAAVGDTALWGIARWALTCKIALNRLCLTSICGVSFLTCSMIKNKSMNRRCDWLPSVALCLHLGSWSYCYCAARTLSNGTEASLSTVVAALLLNRYHRDYSDCTFNGAAQSLATIGSCHTGETVKSDGRDIDSGLCVCVCVSVVTVFVRPTSLAILVRNTFSL